MKIDGVILNEWDFESEMLEMQNAGIDYWEGFAFPDELDQA